MIKQTWRSYQQEIAICWKQLKNKKTRQQQIPNLLTASRILAPLFIVPSLLMKQWILAAIFVTLFAITDFLDGYLARKYNAISNFGRELDPICDKIFALGMLIPLIYFQPMMIVILFLEGLIAFINTYFKMLGYPAKTNYIGKAKTCILFVLFLLSYLCIANVIPLYIVAYGIVITGIIQVITVLCYLENYAARDFS